MPINKFTGKEVAISGLLISDWNWELHSDDHCSAFELFTEKRAIVQKFDPRYSLAQILYQVFDHTYFAEPVSLDLYNNTYPYDHHYAGTILDDGLRTLEITCDKCGISNWYSTLVNMMMFVQSGYMCSHNA